MGKQAKIKKLNRTKKFIAQLIEESFENGKIIESDDGKFHFTDSKIADKFYTAILSDDQLFMEFIEDNPGFIDYMSKALEAQEKIFLELPQK